MDGRSDGALRNGGIEASEVEVQAEGDEQGGYEDGVTGRMIGGWADEEMDAGRSGSPSKTDRGSRTILEQEKQHDESGRDEADRVGKVNVELGILDDNQPGWIFLDVVTRSGLHQSPSTDQSYPTCSSLFVISRADLRHFDLSSPFRTRLLSHLSSIFTLNLDFRSSFIKTYERGPKTGRRVCMGFDSNSCFCFFRNGIFCNTISSFCSDERYTTREIRLSTLLWDGKRVESSCSHARIVILRHRKVTGIAISDAVPDQSKLLLGPSPQQSSPGA
jgi:hypothetical protein